MAPEKIFNETRNNTMNQLQKAYLLLQENCGIKVGDTVMVLRKAGFMEAGWNNSWTSQMEEAIGKTGTVTDIDPCGIRVNIKEAPSLYPFFVLEKLTPDWTEKLCEDVPALCYVTDSDREHGNLMCIKRYNDNRDHPFVSFTGTQWRHAELVPKELLQAMLERYYN